VGNRATAQLIKADAMSLPDVELPDEYIFEKDQGERKGDRSPAAPGGTARAGTGAPKGGRAPGRTAERPAPLRVGKVNLEVGSERDDDAAYRGRAADALNTGAVANEWSNPQTDVDEPFGSENFDVEMTGIKVDVPKRPSFLARTFQGKKPDPVTVDYTIKVKASWGVKGDGYIDIDSPDSPAITAANYKSVVSDLTPVMIEKSWRAPRRQFWSQAICERHEKFHSTDDKAWAEGAGKDVVGDYVGKQKVKPSQAPQQVTQIMKKATELMGRENTQFYTGGANSYLSYAGEERAFGDGRQPYVDLAAAVKSKGEALEQAAKEKAKNKKATTSATIQPLTK
jgi:hypothetical protein